MKTFIAAAIRCYLVFVVPTVTYAISSQWDLDPISGDWNTAANWTPNGVPNGPADIATFGLSNTSDVSVSANTQVDSIVFTSAATNPYNITVASGLTLTLSGAGITNNSGTPQNFFVSGFSEESGQMHFVNSASAGNATLNCFGSFFGASSVQFSNRSTAGSAIIDIDGGSLKFFNSSTADSATIGLRSAAYIDFFDGSTAGNAHFISEAGLFSVIMFHDNSTAANAIVESVEGSQITFLNHSTWRLCLHWPFSIQPDSS